MRNKDTREYWTAEDIGTQDEFSKGSGMEDEPVFDGPYSREKRQKRRRKKKRYLLKFFLFLLFCGGLWYFLQSDVFTIEKIHISGTEHFTKAEVKKMIDLKKGINLVHFSATKAERILENEPYIASAVITKKWTHGIDVQIRERIETVQVQKGNRYFVLDREGMVLQILNKSPNKPPLVCGISVVLEPKVGETIQAKPKQALIEVLDILETAQNEELEFQKPEIKAGLWRIQIKQNIYCKGKAKNIIKGMEEGKLQAILKRLKTKNIKKGMIHVGEGGYFSFNKKTT